MSDWKDKRVRTTHAMTSGVHAVPAGTECTVTDVSPGLYLQGDPCKCCAVSWRMSRVDYRHVTLIANTPQPRLAPTSCGYCTYDEAEGELLSQCAQCKAVDEAKP